MLSPVFQDAGFHGAGASERAQGLTGSLVLNHHPTPAISRDHAEVPVRLGLLLAELAVHYGLTEEAALSELTTALPAGIVNLPRLPFEFAAPGLTPAIA